MKVWTSYQPGDIPDLDLTRLPRHVAIIMDGNGRWATRRGLPRVAGHRKGAQTVREVVRESGRLGIEVLTLYAFSTENWNRPQEEVSTLMELLVRYIASETPELVANRVRLVFIGDLSRLSQTCRTAMETSMAQTTHNPGLTLNVAVNYGGRAEIVQAVRRLAQSVREGSLAPQDITEETVSDYLYTAGQPDPDLLIRTGGDMRLSNFLLYQSSYAELYMPEILWPDFDREAYWAALRDFAGRDRRFGRVR